MAHRIMLVSLLIVSLFWFATPQSVAAHQVSPRNSEKQDAKLKCRLNAKEYLKQADSSFQAVLENDKLFNISTAANISIAASLLYQICSQIEQQPNKPNK